MPMARFDGYGFVLRERALAAFLVLANYRLVGGEIPQLPDLRNGDRRFVPRVLVAFDVHEELLASVMSLLIFCQAFSLALTNCFDCHNAVERESPCKARFIRTSTNLQRAKLSQHIAYVSLFQFTRKRKKY